VAPKDSQIAVKISQYVKKSAAELCQILICIVAVEIVINTTHL